MNFFEKVSIFFGKLENFSHNLYFKCSQILWIGSNDPWTEELVQKVFTKINYLLNHGVNITAKFDIANETADPDHTKYVYDPTNKTITPDCDVTTPDSQCKAAWIDQRQDDIAFSSRKLLRLAFHDCVPYENGGDGKPCDGCINLEKDINLEHNNGLQQTIAVLVS